MLSFDMPSLKDILLAKTCLSNRCVFFMFFFNTTALVAVLMEWLDCLQRSE